MVVAAGYFLILAGAAFIVFGLVAAWRLAFRRPDPSRLETASAGDLSELVKAIRDLYERVASGPIWLAFTFVGGALIYFGTQLVRS